ncbi:hypothetical protein D3C75_1271650 [compost metagenome]
MASDARIQAGRASRQAPILLAEKEEWPGRQELMETAFGMVHIRKGDLVGELTNENIHV